MKLSTGHHFYPHLSEHKKVAVSHPIPTEERTVLLERVKMKESVEEVPSVRAPKKTRQRHQKFCSQPTKLLKLKA